MGLKERIEREIRAAFRQAASDSTATRRVNVAGRVNKVVVRNVGAGTAAASAEQTAPIVQEPAEDRD